MSEKRTTAQMEEKSSDRLVIEKGGYRPEIAAPDTPPTDDVMRKGYRPIEPAPSTPPTSGGRQ